MKRQYHKRSFFPDGRERHLWMHGYHRHIGSANWKRFRREVIEQRGNRCEQCGQEGRSLVLHHLHYKTIGNEQPEDVQLLCRDCHERADEKRAAVNRALGQSQQQTRSAGTGTSSGVAEPSEVCLRGETDIQEL